MRSVSVAATCFVLLAGCQGVGSEATDETAQTTQADSVARDLRAALREPPRREWTAVDESLVAPIWSGDDDHGSLYMPLFRGAGTALEDVTWTPPDHDCRPFKGTVRIDWDAARDTVHVFAKYHNLPMHPSGHRTEGVDWEPDPFHNAPKDVEVGAYRLWIVVGSAINTSNFYYSPFDLNLMGSDFDFPNGPNGPAIPIRLPVFNLTASQEFNADPSGTTVHDWTTSYAHVSTEGGDYSGIKISFLPLNLCVGNPAQPIAGQLRPYVTPWLHETLSWKTILHSGLVMDTTVDDAQHLPPELHGMLPYGPSGFAFLGNAPAAQGGVPNGWRLSVPSVIQNVAPVFRQIPSGNGLGCEQSINDPHFTAPNFCQQQH